MKNVITTTCPVKLSIAKYFIGVAITLTMLSAKANYFSAFNLKMFDGGMFSVVIDNNAACSQSTVFSVASIQPGNHKLKVIRYVQNPYSYYPMQKVVYKGWITIPPQSVMYAQIDCHSQFDVVKVEPYFCPPAGGGNGWDDDCDDDYGYGTNCGYEGNGWGYNPAPPAPPMPMCMSQIEFMQLKNSMEGKSFESSKLQIAKQALTYNNFTSAQVADLMTVFSFESTRLDFAKFAYPKVIDQQNYYLTNNSFSFESSIQDLNQYIAGK